MLQSEWIQEQMDHEFNAQYDDHHERYHSSFLETEMENQIAFDYEQEMIAEAKANGTYIEPEDCPVETPMFDQFEDDDIPF